ncbi:hypothetical protein AN958_02421, partial [Leucoagaricus sp. SymC.cos]
PPSVGFLPAIQPNDFRASVILPEFSQQFPVLRSGAQITIGDLKNRFADQRARGSANQVSEEEEDMILDALRFRSRGLNNAQRSQETLSTDNRSMSSQSNVTASPSSSRSKRYSNNLFGSGRLRDYTYMRSVTSRSKGSLASSTSMRTDSSITPTESSVVAGRINSIAESESSTSLRPQSPEGTVSASSTVSSSLQASSPHQGVETKTMNPAAAKRASLALQQAIQELEDEGEDEIVLPRSRTPHGAVLDASDSRASYSSTEAGVAVAVSADKQIPSGSEEHRTSPLPSRILPGYIPGMNRPMTPRDFDDRSHSTTPRATSPVMNNNFQPESLSSLSVSGSQAGTGLFRKESISAATVRQSPRPGTPSLFLQRTPSLNGRHTPEAPEGIRRSGSGGDSSIDLESPSNSSLLSRRRPTSPLSNLAGTSDVFSSNRSQRSPTPTQNAPRSPSSPAFGFTNGGSRRSSRQTATSPWGFTGAPYGAPMLNLFGNSSRTSFGSTGSSYHSREGDKDDRYWYDSILNGEEPQPVWHDLSVGKEESPLSEDQAEELLRKYFGLTVADIASVQEKLVTFAGTKGEVVRKRRPSTSQSTYVPPGRVNGPPPQIVQVAASSATLNSPTAIGSALTSEQYNQKANALLDSVVSDIRVKHPPPPPTPPPPLDTSSSAVQRAPPSDPSPGTKRNHSLADVLFGPRSNLNEDSVQTLAESRPESQTATPSTSSVTQSPDQLSRNPSTSRVTMSPQNEADLMREFQVKIAQADATMKSASRSHLPGEGLAHSGSISRKRIDTSQIGTPQLLSHSNPASLETLQTIPSRSPTLSTSNNSGASKFGSRFKKLRGTLRGKHSSLAEEAASPASSSSTPPNVKSPISPQTANYDPAKFRGPGSPALASATEPGQSKISLPSPPASAGPGIKGFISRFRGKQRATEPPASIKMRLSPQLSAHPPPFSPLTPRQPEALNVRTPTAVETGLAPPTPKHETIGQNPNPSPVPTEPSPSSNHTASPSASSRQSVMIQQLFDAANNLGLDQNALNDLLMRSGSISTRTTKLARGNLQAARSNSRQGQRSETPIILDQSNSGDTSQLTIQPPSPTTSRPSQSTPESGTRPLAFRPPEQVRRTRENRGDRATSAVVRRTLILPEQIKGAKGDVQSILSRANSGKRRRTSVNSGSLKDRAPTPPPPRSPIGQRFSTDGSPPVPSLPHSLTPDLYLTAPRPNMTSTYDSSIYEMYAQEGRAQSAVGMDPPHAIENTAGPSESGPALEFIEYADGNAIWSIVSGLRSDDDEESIYNGRASFASEYSTGTQGGQEWDNMQVTVREHTRSSSRGSYSSFALKSKKQGAQGKSRPETKVFYGSSAQIGQLIENLSQGMDSGSFNFTPSPARPGHSTSSSLSTNDITDLAEPGDFAVHAVPGVAAMGYSTEGPVVGMDGGQVKQIASADSGVVMGYVIAAVVAVKDIGEAVAGSIESVNGAVVAVVGSDGVEMAAKNSGLTVEMCLLAIKSSGEEMSQVG